MHRQQRRISDLRSRNLQKLIRNRSVNKDNLESGAALTVVGQCSEKDLAMRV